MTRNLPTKHPRSLVWFALAALLLGLGFRIWRAVTTRKTAPAPLATIGIADSPSTAGTRRSEPARNGAESSLDAPEPVAAAVAVERTSIASASDVLRGRVIVRGRAESVPMRGTVSLERSASTGANWGQPWTAEVARAEVSPEGRFALAGVPTGVLYLRTSIEGTQESVALVALDAGNPDRTYDVTVRAVRDVAVRLARDPAGTDPVLHSRDVSLEWTTAAVAPGDTWDAGRRAVLPTLSTRERRDAEDARNRALKELYALDESSAPERRRSVEETIEKLFPSGRDTALGADRVDGAVRVFDDQEITACLVLFGRVVAAERVPPGVTQVEIRIDAEQRQKLAGGIEVVVEERDTHRPAARAFVQLKPVGSGDAEARTRTCDERGLAAFGLLLAGTYELRASSCESCAAVTSLVTLEPGAPIARQRLSVAPVPSVSGRVRAGAQPLDGAQVLMRVLWVRAAKASFCTEDDLRLVRADVRPDGTYRFDRVEPGPYEVRVLAGSNASEWEPAFVNADRDSVLDLQGP